MGPLAQPVIPMHPDRMGCSLLPFTVATASHTRWGVDYWNQFEACNVLTPFDGNTWNSGEFAPVSLTVGWRVPQHYIAGLWLSPDMVPETGMVEVAVRTKHETLCVHTAEWTHGRIFSIFFPRAVHTAELTLTFTQSPSWISLYWAQAWQFRGDPTVVKRPIALGHTALQRRRPFTGAPPPSSSPSGSPPPPPPNWSAPPRHRNASSPAARPQWVRGSGHDASCSPPPRT